MVSSDDRIDRPWGDRTPYGRDERWPIRVDLCLADGACSDMLRHGAAMGADGRQGVYRSHQATAAAVQINNLRPILGMLGRPGAGVPQMNGQPTAQNIRACGADGDLPGFRDRQNETHVADLASVWHVEPDTIPSSERDNRHCLGPRLRTAAVQDGGRDCDSDAGGHRSPRS